MGTPQSVGRIYHVTIIVKPGNFDHCIETYSKMLGISFSAKKRLDDYGVINAVSFEAGLEILAPLDTESVYAKRLQERGEGCHYICFGVADIDEAVGRARASGATVLFQRDALVDAPQLTGQFDRFQIAQLDPLFGTGFVLEQIEKR
jgi:4-hydroxyphenylpyruvate dioxygenase-like putative hemolysin